MRFSHLFRNLPRSFASGASVVAAFSIVFAGIAPAADWPQWHGPARDGISKESQWTSNFPAGGPKILWKVNVGIGCSSMAVVGDRIFTMGNESQDRENGTVYCVDVQTGSIVWRNSYPSKLDPKYFDGGQLSTPTVDGDVVYTLGRQGQLYCLKRSTGAPVWKKDLVEDFGGEVPTWGYAGSPLVLGDKLIIDNGGKKGASVIALNKANGKLVWKAGDDIAGYASPYAFEHKGRTELAVFNGIGLVIRDASEGKEISRYPWKTSYDVNAAMPVISGDKVFIASGYGHGGALLQMGSSSLSKVWETKAMKTKMNSAILWQGHLYGFDEGELTCLDFESGAVKWKQKGLGLGSLIVASGKLIILSEQGDLVFAEATPSSYKELARARVLSKTCWTNPVLANGRIYCRNNSGDLAAVDVSGK